MEKLTHKQIWSAIDELASCANMSASGLARNSGLDPTSFNPSKRFTSEGSGLYKQTAAQNSVPLIGFAQAGVGGFFDDGGFPVGQGWDEIAPPTGASESAYALKVSGDSMMPLYREGDIIIVDPTAQVRKGDRVVAKTREGEVLAKTLERRNASIVELQSINPDHDTLKFKPDELEWLARIVHYNLKSTVTKTNGVYVCFETKFLM